MVTGGEGCPALTQGASPHPPAHSWALTTPAWAQQRGKHRAALPEGWKIAVGSIPSPEAFIIHSSLDDREKVRADLKQNWPFFK